MTELAQAALFRAVVDRLGTTPDQVWDNRVFKDIAPPDADRPYVIYALAGGGEFNERRRRPDAELTLIVKVVAESFSVSLTGGYQLSVLLNDAGSQDGATTPLSTGSSWIITTTTQDRAIDLTEDVDGALLLFHTGFYLIARMSWAGG
jgi:hypothetical protein